jgi:hypothetical protein
MSTPRWLLLLIIVGTVIRIGLWVAYEPTPSPDTGSYVRAAEDLLAGNITREGRRTPGYPLVVALAGAAPKNIVAIQMIIGVVISVLLFYIALLMTSRPGFAFAVGMTYHVNLQQLFFESTLLSETACTLGVVAVTLVMLTALHRIRLGGPISGLAILAGLLAGGTALIRPQFVFLPLLLPVVIAWASAQSRHQVGIALRNAALIMVPAVILILSWCSVIYVKFGFFTLSTQSGLGLVNHSAAFVEDAPDRYATIRDILLKHRAVKLKEQGHAGTTIWDALPEIEEATGMSLPEISREVQQMSLELFAKHPVRYGLSVARGWIEFWTVPNPARFERVRPVWLGGQLRALWWVEHKLLRLINLVFLALVLAVIFFPRTRHRTKWDLDLTFVSAAILSASLVQALAEYGTNSRYAVPIQALVVLAVLVASFRARDIPPDSRAPLPAGHLRVST